MPNIPAVAPNSYDLPLSAGPNYPLYGDLYFYVSDNASSFASGGSIHNAITIIAPVDQNQEITGYSPIVGLAAGTLIPGGPSSTNQHGTIDWLKCQLLDSTSTANLIMTWAGVSTAQFYGALCVPSTDTYALYVGNPSYAVPGQIWYSPSDTSFQTGLAQDVTSGTYAVGIIPQNILVFTGSETGEFYQDAEISTLQAFNPGVGNITLPPNYLNAPNKLIGIDAELTSVLWSTGSTNYALYLLVSNDPTFATTTKSTQIFSTNMVSTSTSYSFIIDGRLGFANRGSTASISVGFTTNSASTILGSNNITQIAPLLFENYLSTINLTQPVTIALASQFTGRSGSASTANAAQMVTRFITFRSES